MCVVAWVYVREVSHSALHLLPPSCAFTDLLFLLCHSSNNSRSSHSLTTSHAATLTPPTLICFTIIHSPVLSPPLLLLHVLPLHDDEMTAQCPVYLRCVVGGTLKSLQKVDFVTIYRRTDFDFSVISCSPSFSLFFSLSLFRKKETRRVTPSYS